MTLREAQLLPQEIDRIVAEYADRLTVQAVIDCATECREELVSAGVQAGLAPALKTMTLMRLRQRGITVQA